MRIYQLTLFFLFVFFPQIKMSVNNTECVICSCDDVILFRFWNDDEDDEEAVGKYLCVCQCCRDAVGGYDEPEDVLLPDGTIMDIAEFEDEYSRCIHCLQHIPVLDSIHTYSIEDGREVSFDELVEQRATLLLRVVAPRVDLLVAVTERHPRELVGGARLRGLASDQRVDDATLHIGAEKL